MNTLKKQVGPFPLYAWLAGGAVLIVSLVIFMRMRASSPSGNAANDAAGATPPPLPYPTIGTTAANPPATPPPTGGDGGDGKSGDGKPPPTQPGPTQKTTAIVSYPAGTWIQTGPHVTSPIVTNVPVGTSLDVTGRSVPGDNIDGVGYWTPVSYGGIEGFVSNARVNLMTQAVDVLNSVLTPTQQFAGALGQTISG